MGVLRKKQQDYLPALNYDVLTPLYDWVIRWTLRETTIKSHLVELTRVQGGYGVLDLGCGTATLSLLIKKMHPGSEVIGLDGDPRILAIARAKAARAGVEIKLDQGMSFELPYPDGLFDRVVSSLFFHHLTSENKRRTTREIFRVLRPGGELHLADFGPPHNAPTRMLASVMKLGHGAGRMADNLEGRLPEIFGEAGFVEARATTHYSTVYGSLTLYQARKP